MEAIVNFLSKSQIQYFSTTGLDNRPKVRPFQFMMEEDGKLFFCTSNKKKVYAEIEKQPFVEICASGEKFSWLRLNGKVVFIDNMKTKEKIVESSPIVKSIYKTADNPDFEVFYLADGMATIYDLSGNPPKEFEI